MAQAVAAALAGCVSDSLHFGRWQVVDVDFTQSPRERNAVCCALGTKCPFGRLLLLSLLLQSHTSQDTFGRVIRFLLSGEG